MSSSAAHADALFVGVDGGGTKTAISIVSSSGAVLANLTVGSSNPNSVGDAGAADTVRNGIQAALKQIDADISSVRGAVLSISGCNSAADGLRVNTWLDPLFPGATWSALPGAAVGAPPAAVGAQAVQVNSYNDSIAALVSGTPDAALEGVVLIAGTGMICKGLHADGREWTSGGNGALIDSGSGYSMGINVLRAAFAAHDGMGPSTPLLDATLKFLDKERPEQLVDWLYADSAWARVGSLAPLAFRFAEASPADPVALSIVDGAAEFLVRAVRAVATKLGWTAAAGAQSAESQSPVTVVCAGGLLQHPLLFSRVRDGVRSFLPAAQLVYPRVSASEGAALLAMRQAKNQPTQQA